METERVGLTQPVIWKSFKLTSYWPWKPCLIPYSGKLSREKTFANWWKYDFAEKTFVDCSLLQRQRMSCPKFRGENFAYSYKTAKFAKVFSLESFSLYGMIWKMWINKNVVVSLQRRQIEHSNSLKCFCAKGCKLINKVQDPRTVADLYQQKDHHSCRNN